MKLVFKNFGNDTVVMNMTHIVAMTRVDDLLLSVLMNNGSTFGISAENNILLDIIEDYHNFLDGVQ